LFLVFLCRYFVTSRLGACYFAIARQGLSTPLRMSTNPAKENDYIAGSHHQ
jgi:hypothetical protein